MNKKEHDVFKSSLNTIKNTFIKHPKFFNQYQMGIEKILHDYSHMKDKNQRKRVSKRILEYLFKEQFNLDGDL